MTTLGPYPPLPTGNRQDYAFRYRDPEGAPSADGNRYHSAVDWFTTSKGGDPVRAPHDGVIVESRTSGGDTSGQVFGGTLKLQDPTGRVWVFRHVEPAVPFGDRVDRGDIVAHITRWRDWPGGSHAHHEIWRGLGGGYSHENMVDPATVEWDTRLTVPTPPPPFGASLRLVLGERQWAGWDEAGPAMRWVTRNGVKPDTPCAISWRGNVWRGRDQVIAVCTNLTRRFLNA